LETADVPCLQGHLSWDGGRFGRVFPWRAVHVTVPATYVYERKLDAQPEHSEAD